MSGYDRIIDAIAATQEEDEKRRLPAAPSSPPPAETPRGLAEALAHTDAEMRRYFNERNEARASAATLRAALPDDLRAAGWAVAVHNDYRQNGEAHTFWLFTKGDRCVKGEGRTDAEALAQARALAAVRDEGKGATAPAAEGPRCDPAWLDGAAHYQRCPACGVFAEEHPAIRAPAAPEGTKT